MDKYHIYNDIGKGDYSEVFKGREKKCIEYVAIKRVEKSMMAKIVAEVQILHKFKNPHVLRFHDWYETRNNLWLILEYCTGGDLAKLLREDGTLPETAVRMFGLDVLAGLKYIHSLGIIHGDLRPQNFLIDEFGILKIADFKYARKIPTITIQTAVTTATAAATVAATAAGSSSASSSSHESTNQQQHEQQLEEDSLLSVIQSRGFVPYLSAELFTREGVPSYATDLWQLGCLLYELRTGSQPFTLDSSAHSSSGGSGSSSSSHYSASASAVVRDSRDSHPSLGGSGSGVDAETHTRSLMRLICDTEPVCMYPSSPSSSTRPHSGGSGGSRSQQQQQSSSSSSSSSTISPQRQQSLQKAGVSAGVSASECFSPAFLDLLQWLLEKSPLHRCTWDQIPAHPFWDTYAASTATDTDTASKQHPTTVSSLPPQPAYEAYIRGLITARTDRLYRQLMTEEQLTHDLIHQVEQFHQTHKQAHTHAHARTQELDFSQLSARQRQTTVTAGATGATGHSRFSVQESPLHTPTLGYTPMKKMTAADTVTSTGADRGIPNNGHNSISSSNSNGNNSSNASGRGSGSEDVSASSARTPQLSRVHPRTLSDNTAAITDTTATATSNNNNYNDNANAASTVVTTPANRMVKSASAASATTTTAATAATRMAASQSAAAIHTPEKASTSGSRRQVTSAATGSTADTTIETPGSCNNSSEIDSSVSAGVSAVARGNINTPTVTRKLSLTGQHSAVSQQQTPTHISGHKPGYGYIARHNSKLPNPSNQTPDHEASSNTTSERRQQSQRKLSSDSSHSAVAVPAVAVASAVAVTAPTQSVSTKSKSATKQPPSSHTDTDSSSSSSSNSSSGIDGKVKPRDSLRSHSNAFLDKSSENGTNDMSLTAPYATTIGTTATTATTVATPSYRSVLAPSTASALVSVSSLLQHSSDTQVKPVVENKAIEVIDKPVVKVSALQGSFAPLDADSVSQMTQGQLDTHLTAVYKALLKCSPPAALGVTASSGATGTAGSHSSSGYQAALTIERVNILTYLLSLSSVTEVANTMLSSQLLPLLLRSLRQSHTAAATAGNTSSSSSSSASTVGGGTIISSGGTFNVHVYSCRVLAATALALAIRYATFIPPPPSPVSVAAVKGKEDAHILTALVGLLKELHNNNNNNNDSSSSSSRLLRRRAAAALGELVFYIASSSSPSSSLQQQQQQHHSDNNIDITTTSSSGSGATQNTHPNTRARLPSSNSSNSISSNNSSSSSNNNSSSKLHSHTTALTKKSSPSSTATTTNNNINSTTNSSSNTTNPQWTLPTAALTALAHCLCDEQDEVVVHYAAKTIENVLSQSQQSQGQQSQSQSQTEQHEYKQKFCTVDIARRLLDIIHLTKNESLQATCGMAAAHIFHFVATHPHPDTLLLTAMTVMSETSVTGYGVSRGSTAALASPLSSARTPSSSVISTPRKSNMFTGPASAYSAHTNTITSNATNNINGSNNNDSNGNGNSSGNGNGSSKSVTSSSPHSPPLVSVPLFFLHVLSPITTGPTGSSGVISSSGSSRLDRIVASFPDGCSVKLQQAYLNILNTLLALNLHSIRTHSHSQSSTSHSGSDNSNSSTSNMNTTRSNSSKKKAVSVAAVTAAGDDTLQRLNRKLNLSPHANTSSSSSSGSHIHTAAHAVAHTGAHTGAYGSGSDMSGEALVLDCSDLAFDATSDLYALYQLRCQLTQAPSLTQTVMSLTEHGGTSAVRAKALLCVQLLCQHSAELLTPFMEKRGLATLIHRSIEPIFNTHSRQLSGINITATTTSSQPQSQKHQQQQVPVPVPLTYTAKAAVSMVYYLRDSAIRSVKIMKQQLSYVNMIKLTAVQRYAAVDSDQVTARTGVDSTGNGRSRAGSSAAGNGLTSSHMQLYVPDELSVSLLLRAATHLQAVLTTATHQPLLRRLLLCNSSDEAFLPQHLVTCLTQCLPLQELLDTFRHNPHIESSSDKLHLQLSPLQQQQQQQSSSSSSAHMIKKPVQTMSMNLSQVMSAVEEALMNAFEVIAQVDVDDPDHWCQSDDSFDDSGTTDGSGRSGGSGSSQLMELLPSVGSYFHHITALIFHFIPAAVSLLTEHSDPGVRTIASVCLRKVVPQALTVLHILSDRKTIASLPNHHQTPRMIRSNATTATAAATGTAAAAVGTHSSVVQSARVQSTSALLQRMSAYIDGMESDHTRKRTHQSSFERLCVLVNNPAPVLQYMTPHLALWLSGRQSEPSTATAAIVSSSSISMMLPQHTIRMLIDCFGIDKLLSYSFVCLLHEASVLHALVPMLRPTLVPAPADNSDDSSSVTSARSTHSSSQNTANCRAQLSDYSRLPATVTATALYVDADPAIASFLCTVLDLCDAFSHSSQQQLAVSKSLLMDTSEMRTIAGVPLRLLECGLSTALVDALTQLLPLTPTDTITAAAVTATTGARARAVGTAAAEEDECINFNINIEAADACTQLLLAVLIFSVRSITLHQDSLAHSHSLLSNPTKQQPTPTQFASILVADTPERVEQYIDRLFHLLQPLLGLTPLLLKIFSVVHGIHRHSLNRTSAVVRNESPPSSSSSSDECVMFMQEMSNASAAPVILETLSRCLNCLFDLFPEAVTTHLLLPLPPQQQQQGKVDARVVLANALADHRLEVKLRCRVSKFLLGAAKVSASPAIALSHSLRAFVYEGPLLAALTAVTAATSATATSAVKAPLTATDTETETERGALTHKTQSGDGSAEREREAWTVFQSVAAQTLQLAHWY